jgi:hypothetical protein
MPERIVHGRRRPLDLDTLSLGRRALYRRILALLATHPQPFVIGGALGLSLQLGRLIDGELEVYFNADAVPDALRAIEATGLKVEHDDSHGKARIRYGDHRITVRWRLPTPLFGGIDDAWFNHARRTRFLGLRVKVAPVEELLWLRIAVPSAASVGDPLISQLLLGRGEHLDWLRLLTRMAGLEALLLSHLFLFWHRYPESAREVVPRPVIQALLERLDQASGSEESTASRSLLDPRLIEEGLAEQSSLHGGG